MTSLAALNSAPSVGTVATTSVAGPVRVSGTSGRLAASSDDAFALESTPGLSAKATHMNGLSPVVAGALKEFTRIAHLPATERVDKLSAGAYRTNLFAKACSAAETPGDACAIVDVLGSASQKEAGSLMACNPIAALLVRVRDGIALQTRQGLVARLDALTAVSCAAVPLLVALAPEHYASISQSVRSDWNLTEKRYDLVTPNLDVALANLPTAIHEKARRQMLATIGASASAVAERDGHTQSENSPATLARRNNEVLLTRLARPKLHDLLRSLDGVSVETACQRLDAFHDALYAGLGGGRGNPGFRNVVAAGEALRQHWPATFTDADEAYVGGSFANAKWRRRDSDIDLGFGRNTSRTVIAAVPGRDKKWALTHNDITDWLRRAEQQIQHILGTSRAEGELLSLAIRQQEQDGTLVPTGPELLAANFFAVRFSRTCLKLHVFDIDEPMNPPIYARPS